jgi:hypothetical protein
MLARASTIALHLLIFFCMVCINHLGAHLVRERRALEAKDRAEKHRLTKKAATVNEEAANVVDVEAESCRCCYYYYETNNDDNDVKCWTSSKLLTSLFHYYIYQWIHLHI